MSTLSPEQWLTLKPYLNQALEMDDDRRAAWLSSLSVQNPELTAQLTSLIDEHNELSKAGFMEKSPTPLLKTEPGLAGQSIGPYLDFPHRSGRDGERVAG